MAAPSSESLSGTKQVEIMNNQKQALPHSLGEGASYAVASSPPGSVMASSSPGASENPDAAEVVALSPKTLLAPNRFMCDVCEKGFQREQNLQLHRRGHNLPWKLKKKTSNEIRKKVFICPERDCVHHDPSRGLGDLTGVKKHFSRKHCEKKLSCNKCNKKYAIPSDLKAHDKICGTKKYKCLCGTAFSRHDNFISHRSSCGMVAEEVARHTVNSSLNSKAASIPANASNPGSITQGMAAGSLISPAGNHQQLPSLPPLGASPQNSFTGLLSTPSVGSQPANVSLYPFPGPGLSFSRVSDISGVQGIWYNTAPSNMVNLGFSGPADLNTDNSFSGLLLNVESSAYNVLNSTPYNPALSATAILQKATLTGANSNNGAFTQIMGSSLSGGMKFNSYGGASGDGPSGGGRGVGSSFQEMYGNFNVDGGSYGPYGSTGGYGGGMEYFNNQMNASYGGISADGMLVGQVNNNVVVEPQMNVESEYTDKLTRDFLGMGNGPINSFSTGGVREDDHNGNGMGTNSPDSEATVSADEAMPSVPGRGLGF